MLSYHQTHKSIFLSKVLSNLSFFHFLGFHIFRVYPSITPLNSITLKHQYLPLSKLTANDNYSVICNFPYLLLLPMTVLSCFFFFSQESQVIVLYLNDSTRYFGSSKVDMILNRKWLWGRKFHVFQGHSLLVGLKQINQARLGHSLFSYWHQEPSMNSTCPLAVSCLAFLRDKSHLKT